MKQTIQVIGYWRSKYEPEYPQPVENSASPAQVKTMLKNLTLFISNDCVTERFYKGISNCRICGKNNGSSEYVMHLNSRMLVIPAGLSHYIKNHKVLVPTLLRPIKTKE